MPGIVSPILIIVVAITGTASFAIPDYSFGFHLRVFRFLFIFLGYLCGFLGIALGLSGNGSPLGAIFYIIVWNLLMFFGMKFAYFKGYEMGGKAVELLVGEQAQALRESIIMIGTMVIGAVAASWINIETSFEIPGIIELQSTFDSIYPKLLSGVTVIFCWWLMTKKKISPTVVMGILVVIAFVGVLLGFFDPNLSY